MREVRITPPDESTKAAWGVRPGQNSIKVSALHIEPLFYKAEGDHDVANLEVVVVNDKKERSVFRAVLVIQGKDGKLRLRAVQNPDAVPKFEAALLEAMGGNSNEAEAAPEDGVGEDDVKGEPVPEPTKK